MWTPRDEGQALKEDMIKAETNTKDVFRVSSLH